MASRMDDSSDVSDSDESYVLSSASDETDIDQSSESESDDSSTSSDDGNVPRPTPWLRVYD